MRIILYSPPISWLAVNPKVKPPGLNAQKNKFYPNKEHVGTFNPALEGSRSCQSVPQAPVKGHFFIDLDDVGGAIDRD
jgi:hypothetical protein